MPAAIPKRVEWVDKTNYTSELPFRRRTKSNSEAEALVKQLRAEGHTVIGIFDLHPNEGQ